MGAKKTVAERLRNQEPSFLSRVSGRSGAFEFNTDEDAFGAEKTEQLTPFLLAKGKIFSISTISEAYYKAKEKKHGLEKIKSSSSEDRETAARNEIQRIKTRLNLLTFGKWNPFAWLEVLSYALLIKATRVKGDQYPNFRATGIILAQSLYGFTKTLNAGMSILFGIPFGIAGTIISLVTALFSKKPYAQAFKDHALSAWAPVICLKRYFTRLEALWENFANNPIRSVAALLLVGGLITAAVLLPPLLGPIFGGAKWGLFTYLGEFFGMISKPLVEYGLFFGQVAVDKSIATEIVIAAFAVPAGISLAQEIVDTTHEVFSNSQKDTNQPATGEIANSQQNTKNLDGDFKNSSKNSSRSPSPVSSNESTLSATPPVSNIGISQNTEVDGIYEDKNKYVIDIKNTPTGGTGATYRINPHGTDPTGRHTPSPVNNSTNESPANQSSPIKDKNDGLKQD